MQAIAVQAVWSERQTMVGANNELRQAIVEQKASNDQLAEDRAKMIAATEAMGKATDATINLAVKAGKLLELAEAQ